MKKSIGFGSAVTVSSSLDNNKDSELDQKLAQADKYLQVNCLNGARCLLKGPGAS